MAACDGRFVVTATGLADRQTGLEWELSPVAAALTWEEADDGAIVEGWRLPSLAELMVLLGNPPPEVGRLFPDGATFWSETASPFAPPRCVRAVSIDRAGRLAVLLLDRGERARRWAVRELDARSDAH